MQNSNLTTSPQTLGRMADKFWMNVQKRFKFSFYRENSFFPLDGKIAVLTILAENIWRKAAFFGSLSGNEWKIIIFFWTFVVKMFLWTGEVHFWQSRQKHLARRPGNFHSLSEKDTNFYFFQNSKFVPDMFFSTRRMYFRQPLKKFRRQAEKDCSTSKNARRGTKLLEVFPQNVSYGQVEWMHFGKPDGKSSREDRKTQAHCTKLKKDI